MPLPCPPFVDPLFSKSRSKEVSDLPLSAGGILNSGSSEKIRTISSLSPLLPGTTADFPDSASPLVEASTSSRSFPFRLRVSGP